MYKRKGFTLIELLVVISIISVLLTIIIPAMSTARDQAKSAVCRTRMKQLSFGWFMYSTENVDRLMGGYAGIKGTNENYHPDLWYAWVEFPQNESGIYTGYNLSTEWQDAPLEDKKRGLEEGLIFPYTDNLSAFHCPSDWRLTGSDTIGVQPCWRSYGIAGGMNIPSPYAYHAKKFSNIKSPESKYVFVEYMDPRGWNMGYWEIYVPSRNEARWWNTAASWHRNHSNWSFADGHAETQMWNDDRTIVISEEYDYDKQMSLREWASTDPVNNDLTWIVDRRMNDW